MDSAVLRFVIGNQVYLQSKAGQPLARYFPDITGALASCPSANLFSMVNLSSPSAAPFRLMNCNCVYTQLRVAFRNSQQRIQQCTLSSIFSRMPDDRT